MTISKKDIEKLLRAAKKGMKNAYVPRSNHPVGAAVLTTKGKIFFGCNVESVISGEGICAERCAIDNAVTHGNYKFKSILITSKFDHAIVPCGMCLQYLAEFSQVSGKDIEIIMVDFKGNVKKSSLHKLLPKTYGPKDSGLNLSVYRNRN
jgi:cytidine deaminase